MVMIKYGILLMSIVLSMDTINAEEKHQNADEDIFQSLYERSFQVYRGKVIDFPIITFKYDYYLEEFNIKIINKYSLVNFNSGEAKITLKHISKNDCIIKPNIEYIFFLRKNEEKGWEGISMWVSAIPWSNAVEIQIDRAVKELLSKLDKPHLLERWAQRYDNPENRNTQ